MIASDFNSETIYSRLSFCIDLTFFDLNLSVWFIGLNLGKKLMVLQEHVGCFVYLSETWWLFCFSVDQTRWIKTTVFGHEVTHTGDEFSS